MMKFYETDEGSINCFYKNRLVVSVGLTKFKTKDYYLYSAKTLIEDSLRAGLTIKYLQNEFMNLIKNARYKECIKEHVSKQDREIILISFLGLCKMKVIDIDGIREGILICPKRKAKRENKNHAHQP